MVRRAFLSFLSRSAMAGSAMSRSRSRISQSTFSISSDLSAIFLHQLAHIRGHGKREFWTFFVLFDQLRLTKAFNKAAHVAGVQAAGLHDLGWCPRSVHQRYCICFLYALSNYLNEQPAKP